MATVLDGVAGAPRAVFFDSVEVGGSRETTADIPNNTDERTTR